jgi:4-hydroxy-3-methylbut-2-en-1-yl diphosphate synthase IspG/GcpE
MRAPHACASTPATSAAATAWPKWCARQGQWLRHPHRRERRSLEKDLLEKYGEPCPEALVESALDHIKLLQDHDFHEYKVAVKASDVFLAVSAYMALADAVDCPLHLGITEAGGLIGGTVKSAIGMGNLLWAGIGDTIRVSLSAEPERRCASVTRS